ncbi:hypothetical protein AALP_AA3G102100 [Arabis alpina]|uniref:Uncharacterized protein n=1 Tax=Arabis alpina TaxID=50452 RepID=A0A087H894_ARAAL|nr:hypothetical protein AALP_AA3G102100 [Arabis alpina]
MRSVVAQVTHGRTSVVSRRNFYLNPNPTNETKEAGGNIFAAGTDRLTAAMERSREYNGFLELKDQKLN